MNFPSSRKKRGHVRSGWMAKNASKMSSTAMKCVRIESKQKLTRWTWRCEHTSHSYILRRKVFMESQQRYRKVIHTTKQLSFLRSFRKSRDPSWKRNGEMLLFSLGLTGHSSEGPSERECNARVKKFLCVFFLRVFYVFMIQEKVIFLVLHNRVKK